MVNFGYNPIVVLYGVISKMSKKIKTEKSVVGPINCSILFVFIFIINFALPSLAENSGYYDISDSSRPPSAFSICCCNKENDDGLQVVYSCKYIEAEKCPENSRQYKTVIGDCPSNLMFTKYKSEQN